MYVRGADFDGRWPRCVVGLHPPGAYPSDTTTAAAAHRERTGTDRHGRVRGAPECDDGFRRFGFRSPLSDHAGVRAIEAGQRLILVGTGEAAGRHGRSEEHTSELQSQSNLVCRLLLEKKK